MKQIEVAVKFWSLETNKKYIRGQYRYNITILLVRMRILTLIKWTQGQEQCLGNYR